MKKLALLAGAGLLALGAVGSAQAQPYYGHYGHHGYYRDHGRVNGGALAAGLVGGAILGGVLGATTAPAYATPVASYGYVPAASYGYYGQAAYDDFDEPGYGYYGAPVVRQRVVYAAPRRVVRQRVVYGTPRTVVRNRVAVRQAFPNAAPHEIRDGRRTVFIGTNPSRRVVVSGRAY